MKKSISFLLSIVMVFSLSIAAFASSESKTTTVNGQNYPVYKYSTYTAIAPQQSKRNYNESEQDKINDALLKAMQDMEKETEQSGELQIVGTINNKPLYAKTETTTNTSRSIKTRSEAKTFMYDFGWGAGLEDICKATVKGTFDLTNGKATVVKVDGTYSILDNRCSAQWDDSLKIESEYICQIGFNLYVDNGYSEVSQSAYVDGEDKYYVLIHN